MVRLLFTVCGMISCNQVTSLSKLKTALICIFQWVSVKAMCGKRIVRKTWQEVTAKKMQRAVLNFFSQMSGAKIVFGKYFTLPISLLLLAYLRFEANSTLLTMIPVSCNVARSCLAAAMRAPLKLR